MFARAFFIDMYMKLRYKKRSCIFYDSFLMNNFFWYSVCLSSIFNQEVDRIEKNLKTKVKDRVLLKNGAPIGKDAAALKPNGWILTMNAPVDDAEELTALERLQRQGQPSYNYRGGPRHKGARRRRGE